MQSKSLLVDISFCPLLDVTRNGKKSSILDVELDPSGLPIFTLSTGDMWFYHPGMNTWMLINDLNQSKRVEATRFGLINRLLPSIEQIEVC